jgi:hypothetical protein
LLQERIEPGVVAAAGQCPAQVGAIALVVQRLACNADDPAAGGDLAIEKAMEQRRQQLAYGKVAGTTENDQIEGFDRLGSNSHAFTSDVALGEGWGAEAQRPGSFKSYQ